MRPGYIIGILLILVGCGFVVYDFAERHMASAEAHRMERFDARDLPNMERMDLMARSNNYFWTVAGCCIGGGGVLCVFLTAIQPVQTPASAAPSSRRFATQAAD